MNLQSLELNNFRNHKALKIGFTDGVNLIVGQNGSGKTNILEAIYLLSTGKSFRVRYDHEMIYNHKVLNLRKPPSDTFDAGMTTREFAKVAGTVKSHKQSETDTLEVTIVRENPQNNYSQKIFRLNGAPKRLHDFAGMFNCALFIPQDLEIFTGSPSLRRRFLDDLLYKVDQKYAEEHITYTKALRQRNKLLEKINKTSLGRDELPFWTEKLLQSGMYIQRRRQELMQNLNQWLGQIYAKISNQDQSAKISYKMNELTKERLEKHADHEVYAKSTLVGPHRDDFDFLLGDYNIAHYGSRGQQRTGVLALKMCELNLIDIKTGTPPVLLLDDIFSELDSDHQLTLGRMVQKQQTIITSATHNAGAEKVISL